MDQPLVIVAYAALGASLAVSLFAKRAGWALALVALACGVASHIVTPLALAFLALIYFCVYLSYRANTKLLPRIFAFAASFTLMALAMQHLIPGFHNLKVFDKVVFSPSSAPFTMYLNFDKPFAAFLLLGLGTGGAFEAADNRHPGQALVCTVLAVLFAIGAGCASGFVALDPKYPDGAWLWVANNIFLVCIVEEVIFRRFVMQKILAMFSTRKHLAVPLAVALSSLLFGAAHLRDGLTLALVATAIGIFYAISYVKARSLVAPILTHLAVNVVHFFLFTYPFVAK